MNNQFARILLLEKDQAQVLLTIEWEADHYQLLIRSEYNGVAMSTQLNVADRQTALSVNNGGLHAGKSPALFRQFGQFIRPVNPYPQIP